MPRAKGGAKTRQRRKKILKKAKGYFGGRRKLYRTAAELLNNVVKHAQATSATVTLELTESSARSSAAWHGQVMVDSSSTDYISYKVEYCKSLFPHIVECKIGFDNRETKPTSRYACVELIHHVPTGRKFHRYVNPERDIPDDAHAVHGLTAEFLGRHPLFEAIADELAAFIGEDQWIVGDAGRFDRDVRDALRGEPIREVEQAAGRHRDRAVFVRHAPTEVMRTHATTFVAWTSNPAHRGCSTSISRLLS